ncbi:hypothetical protein M513_12622 [Trichuris suis]|uniref:Uncharacterized protein n=1 Tax=Trichuris suis TaxID=68888 RepID=A0A085LNG2_9BILA|nr:hypothetical protein M513_12622 [Trichuris suis]
MIIKQYLFCIVAYVLYEAEGHRLFSKQVKEVPSYQRPWSVQNYTYNAKPWNEKCRFSDCDPDINSPGFAPKFNKIDGKVNRRRIKACGENLTYEVSDGFPLNPAGRTGLTGRGMLPRYGPNHMMSVMFLWEKGDSKVIVLKRSGKTSYADGFLTGYVSDPKEQPFPDVHLELIKKSLKKRHKDKEKVNKILRNAKKRFVKLMGGSVPSGLETDHAWVELQMFLVPCKKTKKLCTYGLLEIREEYGLQWYDMNTDNVEEMQRNVTTLIDTRRDNYERYSIYCVPDKKYKTIIAFILGNLVLITGLSVGIALVVAAFATNAAIMGGIGLPIAQNIPPGCIIMIIKQLLLCITAYVLYEAEGHENKEKISQLFLKQVKEVPSYRRPWNRQYYRYNPKHWNETCSFSDCDPDIKSPVFQPKFNTIDGNVNRRRIKACGENLTYDVEGGFPLNPAGRTGLTGRGMLPRYGPNHMMSVIFVWEMGDKVLVLKKSGRNSSYGDGFITGFVSDPEEQPFADVPLELIKKSLKQEFSDTERVNKILKNAKKRFVKLVGGSVPSTLETDHAWVELQMFLVPCRKTKKLCRYGLLEIQEEETAGKVSVLKKSSRNSYVDGFITGYINDTEEQPFADVPLKHIRKSLMQQFNDTEKVNKILKKARKRFVKLIGGSVPSSLETDHAWIELEMFLVPCKKTKKLCTYGLSKMQDEFGLRWYDVETHSVEEVNRNVTTAKVSQVLQIGIPTASIFGENFTKPTVTVALKGNALICIAKQPGVVKEGLKSWDKNYTEYEPVFWNAECQFEECDPQIGESRDGISILKKSQNSSYDDGLLTGFVDDSDIQPFPTPLLQEIRASLLQNSRTIGTYPDRIINSEKKYLVRAFGGSVPFSLETDNAWVEWKVFLLQCTDARVLCNYGLSTVRQKYGLDTYHVNGDIDLINKHNCKSVSSKKSEEKLYTVFCESCPTLDFRVFFKRTAVLIAAGPIAGIPLAVVAFGAVVAGVVSFISACLMLPSVIWLYLRNK